MLTDPWEIQLLGGLALRRGEQRIAHFPTEKVGSLLAYLAAYPLMIHTREDLTERFWPDSGPGAGRASLRQALASLRRLLEPPDVPAGAVLIADRSLVKLNPDAIHTDLALWDRMRALSKQASSLPERLHWLNEAVRSYGGIFLPGIYMDWALGERQRRHDELLEALLSLTDMQAECGDYEGAITSARRLLHEDPLSEDGHERLMRLFAEQGQLGLAHRQYRKLSRVLRDELGLEPAPKIQALYADLRHIARKHVNTVSAAPVFAWLDAPPAGPVCLDETDGRPSLPLRLTRFFGRDEELRILSGLLEAPDVRLTTLTGIGGVGKTRLALEAAQQAASFGRAITFVPLGETQESDLLLATNLQTLGVPAVSLSDPLARLAAVLGVQPHLLILDNFEQIVEEGAAIVLKMLEQIPTVVCLVTSRQALKVPGEREMALPPLPVPAANLRPRELAGNPTVQLLLDRMRARRPDFQITPGNAETVAALCARLEGIPLAVELAAGWARDLTVSQMQDRLAHRFDLLVSRQRGIPRRHQSLRATVESSYQLLPPPLQRYFLRLSAFRGGWYEEMARIACDADHSLSETADTERLGTLREHSLITVQETGDRMRYGMLETLRVFGQEMLSTEETHLLLERHAAWFLEFAREASVELHGREQARWFDRLEEERDNLRAALEYSAVNAPALGLQVANALYWFWYVRGYFREGEQWLTLLLKGDTESPIAERAWGLLAAGHFANCQSNNTLAVSRYEAARALFEELGDERGVAHALCRLGNAAQEMLDNETGYRLCAESVARFRVLNDPNGLLLALFYYANTLLEVDVGETGLAVFHEGLALAETLGDIRFQSLLQHCLCHLYRLAGKGDEALQGYRKALQLQRLLREPLPVSYMLRELAFAADVHGIPVLAAHLFGAMQGLRQRMGYPTGPHEQVMLEELESRLHAGLQSERLLPAIKAGRALDFEACLQLACEAAENI